MSAPSTSGLSVELLLRVIDVKYGCFTFTLLFSKKTALLLTNKNGEIFSCILLGIQLRDSFKYNNMYNKIGNFRIVLEIYIFLCTNKGKCKFVPSASSLFFCSNTIGKWPII